MTYLHVNATKEWCKEGQMQRANDQEHIERHTEVRDLGWSSAEWETRAGQREKERQKKREGKTRLRKQ